MRLWARDNPLRQALIDQRCQIADQVAAWVKAVSPCYGPGRPATYPEISANATRVLITVACSLLDRQVRSLAETFEQEGGFTERMYRVRREKRGKP